MAEGDDGRTEQPTGKKISEARSKGKVARSADLSSSVLLLFGTLMLWLFAGGMHRRLSQLMVISFQAIPRYDHFFDNLPRLALQGYLFVLVLIAPFLVTLALIAIATNIAQYGPLWARHASNFSLSQLFNPAALLKFFSAAPLVGIPKNLAKMIVVGLVAYWVVARHYHEYLLLADQSPRQIVAFLFLTSRELLIKCSLLLFLIGLADLVYNKRKYKQGLMMTKQDVRDETKAAEGDPRIRGKIKSLRRQMYSRMMMQELPKATVVITNPTFIAVALRYEQGRDHAPVVVAKGKRLVAERIRDTAKTHAIPIVEDRPLARGLYEVAAIGEEIPQEFFAAVAEILAAIFSLKRPTGAQAAA